MALWRGRLLVLSVFVLTFATRVGAANPPNEVEAQFLEMDASAAMRLCDTDWFAQHLHAEWTAVYTIGEVQERVVNREEYLSAIRDHCVPEVVSAPGDEAVKYINDMQVTQTVVRYEAGPGPGSRSFGVLHFLKLRTEEIQSIQFNDALTRDRDGRVQLFESFVNVTRRR